MNKNIENNEGAEIIGRLLKTVSEPRQKEILETLHKNNINSDQLSLAQLHKAKQDLNIPELDEIDTRDQEELIDLLKDLDKFGESLTGPTQKYQEALMLEAQREEREEQMKVQLEANRRKLQAEMGLLDD